MPEVRNHFMSFSRLSACLEKACKMVQLTVRPLVKIDRQAFLEQRAADAQHAARCHDFGGSFGIVRSLSGNTTSKSGHPVKRKDGLLTSNEQERQERWQEHFADVFGGRIVNKSEIRNSLVEPIVLTSSLETTPQITERAIRRLKRNRGVGVDDIPAELLQAGEGAMAVKVSEVYTRVKDEEQWPTAWAGGRIVDIFKKKGAADE